MTSEQRADLRTGWAQPHDAAGRESAAARARPRAEPVNDEHTSSTPDPLTAALHVTNGDCADLGGTGLVHRSLVWFDVLHEGPVPAVDDDQSRCIRAAYLTAADPVGASEFALRRFRERDQTLNTARDGRKCCGSRPTCTTNCTSCRSSPGSRHSASPPSGSP
jgi:hypothetical protein